MHGELKVFGGRAHPGLVAGDLRLPFACRSARSRPTTSPMGRSFCQVLENVRGTDVFVVQPICQPANENLMELLIMLDTFKRSSAARG